MSVRKQPLYTGFEGLRILPQVPLMENVEGAAMCQTQRGKRGSGGLGNGITHDRIKDSTEGAKMPRRA